jgi:hypothetical protein
MTSHVFHESRAVAANRVGEAGTRGDRTSATTLLPWVGLGSLATLGALVFWVFDALPFQDLPAHAGLIAMRHRFAASVFEQRFFVLAPHVGPYSLFRFLGESFDRVVGPIGAVRTLATLPLLATPLALVYGRAKLHGERSAVAGYLGLAMAFGIMTLFGFASYLLGVAGMLLGLTLWLHLAAQADDATHFRDTQRSELVMAAYAPLMFVGHGHAFVLFLVLAGVSCLVAGDRWRRVLRLRALVPAVGLAAYVAWLERGSETPPGSVPTTQLPLAPHFQGVVDKLSLLFTPTLLTRSGVDILAGVALWLLLALAAAATLRDLRSPPRSTTTEDARSRKHSRALYAGALTMALLFVALPHAIGWFGFVDGRLVPVILYLAILGFRRDALRPKLRAALDRGAPALAATMVTVALVASARFQTEARGWREVLGAVPAEARLLNLPLEPNSEIFTAHPFIHYDKLVLAERPIVVSDVWFHQGSALYPTAENPALHLPSTYSESDLRVIDWPAYRLDEWDYVLLRIRPDSPAPPTPDVLQLVEHRGGWWLFKHR